MDQLFALGHVSTGTKNLLVALYEIMLARCGIDRGRPHAA
jgi:hypothetical protein